MNKEREKTEERSYTWVKWSETNAIVIIIHDE